MKIFDKKTGQFIEKNKEVKSYIVKGDKGDRGDIGPQGPQGPYGKKGEKGDKGIQGNKGDKGDKGDRGDRGDIGPQGPQGIQGLQGEKGKANLIYKFDKKPNDYFGENQDWCFTSLNEIFFKDNGIWKFYAQIHSGFSRQSILAMIAEVDRGNVDGPASSNDNTIVRFDGTTGKLIQGSSVTIDDSGNVYTSGTINGATPTELSYLDATSSIQTQINSKEPTITSGTTSQYLRGDKSFQNLEVESINNQSGHSLMGRHAGGAGAGQEVTLNSSLEFSGATIQRAALSGAITASAGNNVTSLGSFTLLQLNTALSDADVSTGGGTATGTNTGDNAVNTTSNTYADGKIEDTIVNGVTTKAPSQNAVFDALALKENTANKGVANGYASLDSSGLVPTAQLPSYVDDVLEYANLAAFPVTGESNKIYVAIDTGYNYRWSGSVYTQMTDQTAVWGNVSGTLSNQTDLQTALNAKQNTITGAATTVVSSNLTASRAAISNASGKIDVSTTTDTELGYVSGVTSAIQTQLNNKQTTTLTDGNILVGNASNIATSVNPSGDIDISNAGVFSISSGVIVNADVNASAAIAMSKLAAMTASRVLTSDASGFVSASSVTSTTLGYLDATSSIQTQINSKQATITGAATSITSSNLTASRALTSDASGKVAVSTVTDTELGYVSGVTSAIQTQLNNKQSTSLTNGSILIGNVSNVATANAVTGDITISNAGVTAIGSGVIVNADVNASAAIAYSKLAALTSGNILVGNVSNVATSVAMSGDITITNAGVTAIGAGVIVNADVNASAAIAYSKLAALTASRALASDASGFVSAATTTLTELNYVSGVTSAIQTQLNAKQSTTLTNGSILIGNASNVATANAVTGDVTISNAGVTAIASGVIVNADVNASAAIAYSKLAALTANRALISDASGFVSVSTVTNTEIGYLSGVTSAIQTQLNAKEAAQVKGTATINFGATSADTASILVTGLSGLTANHYFNAFIQSSDSTVDNTTNDHRLLSQWGKLTCEYTSATSFTIHCDLTVGEATGTFKIRYIISI
jgi:hypothetical protein